jgi:hypothetical protein
MLARVVLIVCALLFAGFGAAFLLFPVRMAAAVDIALPTPTARIDFRATYGGFELGVAAFLLWCAARRERVRVGLLASGWCIVGFPAARVFGIVLDGRPKPVLLIALAGETIAALACFLLATRLPRAGGGSVG